MNTDRTYEDEGTNKYFLSTLPSFFNNKSGFVGVLSIFIFRHNHAFS